MFLMILHEFLLFSSCGCCLAVQRLWRDVDMRAQKAAQPLQVFPVKFVCVYMSADAVVKTEQKDASVLGHTATNRAPKCPNRTSRGKEDGWFPLIRTIGKFGLALSQLSFAKEPPCSRAFWQQSPRHCSKRLAVPRIYVYEDVWDSFFWFWSICRHVQQKMDHDKPVTGLMSQFVLFPSRHELVENHSLQYTCTHSRAKNTGTTYLCSDDGFYLFNSNLQKHTTR